MRDSTPGAGIGRLAVKIFLVVLVAVALTAGAVVAVRLLLAAPASDPAVAAVSRGWAAFSAEQRDRYARLGLAGRVLAREESLRTVLRGEGEAEGETGEAALVDLLLQRRDELGYDFAIVLDPAGRVVAATDRPDLVGRDLGSQSLVSRALEEGAAAGVWNVGEGRLAHAAVEWVAPEFDLLGYVLVALHLDEVMALEVERTSGAGATFLLPAETDGARPRAVSSSLPAVVAEGLVRELAGPGGALGEMLAAGDTREGVRVDLGGNPYEALLAPLRDADGAPVGTAVIAAPAAAGDVDATLPWLAAGAVAALVLGLFLALLLARGTLAPVKRLAGLVAEAPREGYARRPEPRKAGHLAPVAAALGRLFRDLQEERALSAVAQEAAAGAAGGAEVETEGTKATLVGVDLRRYARAGAGEEPREVGERLAREIARVRSVVARHGGRLALGAGHRILVAFEGDGAPGRAVATAAELLGVLAQRESAFDEGEPPALAVATGRVTIGGLGGDRFLVGPAVQLVESLLREAAGGDLVMPRQVHRQVAAPRLPGLDEPGADAGGAVGLVGAGDPVAPGDVLEDRFEVVAPVPGSPQGDLLRAVDRELGGTVAVRRLPFAVVASPEAADLEGPLGAVRRFSHPGVAHLHDFLDMPGGLLLSRAWVPGAPLPEARDLPLPAALGLARQLAAALAAIHDAGLVHGRVKPENVLLLPGAGIRLTDLGVGLLAGPAPSAAAGERLLAPEQVGGRLGDARSDVYALGALVARLASGRWWTGEGAEADGDLPDGLAAVLGRCIAADPAARYADGGEVLTALGRVG